MAFDYNRKLSRWSSGSGENGHLARAFFLGLHLAPTALKSQRRDAFFSSPAFGANPGRSRGKRPMVPAIHGGSEGNKKAVREAASHATTELLVRGVVPEADLLRVMSVVRLLCPDFGHLGNFRNWDRVFNLSADMRAPRCCLRLRAHLEPPSATSSRPAWAKFSLMHYGILDRRVPAPVEKRPVHVVPIGEEGPDLIKVLGCTQEHEYVRRGERFRTRAGLLVEIFVMEMLTTPGDPATAKMMASDGGAGASSGNAEEKFAIVEVSSDRGASPEELLTFMSYLTPSGVMLKK